MGIQIGVKFTYYRMGISISRMTDLENIQEVMNKGLEEVAEACINEVFSSTGFDLNKLSHPYPATRFCFFSELSHNNNDDSFIEGNRKTVLDDNYKKTELVY